LPSEHGAVAVLKKLVRTVIGDAPQVTADHETVPLAEDVRFQSVELEFVFLLVRERSRLTKNNAPKGRRFDSLDAHNADLRRWNRTVVRVRTHGTTLSA